MIDGIKLIGIHGKAGTGKDTVATFLNKNYIGHYIQSFADPLKEACSLAFGIPIDNFYDPELKETVHPTWETTPRKILQFMGTEVFRSKLQDLIGSSASENFWIKRAHLRLTNQFLDKDEGLYVAGDTVIFPDVRFQNEYDWIINSGGIVIHLTRPGFDGNIGIQNHASEAGINLWKTESTYEIINNTSIQMLYNKIVDFKIKSAL